MQNVETKPVVTNHKDFVHDVAYNYYGKRIATCSSDEHIKVPAIVPHCLSSSLLLLIILLRLKLDYLTH